MSSPFDKSGVYHSQLVKESDRDNPLEITVTCDGPQKSKFNNQPDFISFKIDGKDHYYGISENPRCGDALSGMKGETVFIIATGRGDDADIEVVNAAGEGSRRQRQPARQEQRREERQPQRQERRSDPEPQRQQERKQPAALTEADRAEHFKTAKVLGARCAVLMRIAFKHSKLILLEELGVTRDGGPNYGTEDVRALATTLFIEMRSTTDINKLPHTFINTKNPPPVEQRGDAEPVRHGDHAKEGYTARHQEQERQPAREEQRRREPDLDEASESDIPF